MTVLWAMLLTVFILAFLSRYIPVQSATLHYTYIKPNKFMIILALTCIVLVSGLRNNIGDTYFYMQSYEIQDFTWDHILENKDPGFGVLQMLLKNISNDPQLLIFITALVTNILIVVTLYKYTKMIELSIYVFITSGMFTVSMNGIRQFFAASIIFWATKYLLDGNFKRYFFIILFASTFHESALILIPIYFIVRRKAWTKVTFSLLGLAILLVMGFNEFSQFLFAAIEDTQYGHYSNFVAGGANIIRVFVDSVPIIIAYLGRDKLRKLWPKSDIIVNMSLISLVFMFIATQNWIFARFNIYFSLYNLILISWIILLFKKNNQKFVYYSLLIFYLMYFYYEQVISLSLQYRSDYINF
ncbi:EpsG family protein [Metabacillus sediminilitoris]|uniref:EpsG family protein n=1 Tax=Metabacillus sediminilitoris TaxID=2567941 RepID=A0A4S4C0H4_9BACI|nr:EpsG family protein [Metabacillus sediminilitoris]QGQ47226.1 EpsG family protein [Metabacillus sediminilitoris]THF80569.1 EpsG family protein [Metabacillus sediminilitoris]